MVSDRSNGVYRSVIAALVGLILIGAAELPKKDAQPEQAKEQREIAETLKDIAASLKEAQKPDQSTQPCDPKKPNRNSDLCAQWKAADAATDAAEAAWGQILIGWIGVVLGAITMAAAIAAAIFAKKAAEASEDNARAAIDAVTATNKANLLAMKANARATRQAVASAADTAKALEIAQINAESAIKQVEISELSAKRQLRPYVHIEKILPERPKSGFNSVEFYLKNFGQTPAINLKTNFGAGLYTIGAALWPLPTAWVKLGRDIAPGHFQKAIIGFDYTEDEVRQLIDGLIEIHITYIVEYDGFGIDGADKLAVNVVYTSEGARVDISEKEGNVT